MSQLISELELLQQLRQKNSQALQKVYQANFGVVKQMILNNNGSEQEAKDVFQEAILVLYEKLQESSFELTCQIRTFLYSVARRQWLKKLSEKRKVAGKVEDFAEFISFDAQELEEMDVQEEKMKAVQLAFTELGEPCTTIIQDYYLYKLSMQEISEKMGYTNAQNAKNQKYKCLQRLKKIFFKNYRVEE